MHIAVNGVLIFDTRDLSVTSGSHTYVIYLDDGTGFNIQYTANSGTADLGTVTKSVEIVANNLQEIKITGLTSGAVLSGVTVDGKILVDGTAVWNTSEVWSSGWTGATQTSYEPDKSFDGNFTDGTNSTTLPVSEQDGGTGLLTWTGNIDTTAGNVILYYWNQATHPILNTILKSIIKSNSRYSWT